MADRAMTASSPTYTLGRTCEMCDAPVPDEFAPNDYGLYGHCPECVAEIGDEDSDDDDNALAATRGEQDASNRPVASDSGLLGQKSTTDTIQPDSEAQNAE